MGCVFCRILAGEMPGTFLFRSATVAAFMDIRPVNPGHVLIVPVEHFEFIADVPAGVAAEMFAVAQRMVRGVRGSGLACEGVNLFLADGEAAGQEVFHTHLHVFPRVKGDGVRLYFPGHYPELPARAVLEGHAERIRGALASGRDHHIS